MKKLLVCCKMFAFFKAIFKFCTAKRLFLKHFLVTRFDQIRRHLIKMFLQDAFVKICFSSFLFLGH